MKTVVVLEVQVIKMYNDKDDNIYAIMLVIGLTLIAVRLISLAFNGN